MKVGRERCVQKPGNHAHNAEILKKPKPEHEKSGKENDRLTGFLEKSSIMRMSLRIYARDFIYFPTQRVLSPLERVP